MVLRACITCNTKAYDAEDLELFIISKKSVHGRGNKCKKCRNLYDKEYAKKYPNKVMKKQIQRLYKISREEYLECMSTSTKCEICETTDDLCYDHNHSTMKFRGVLCRNCNAGIGFLKDDKHVILKAYKYIKGAKDGR